MMLKDFGGMQQTASMQRQGDTPVADAETPLDQRGSLAQILNSKSPTNGSPCYRCQGLGNSSLKCLGNIRCWKCSSFGHSQKYCLPRSKISLWWKPKTNWEPIEDHFVTWTKSEVTWRPKLQIERQSEKDGNMFQDSRADNSDALSSLNAEQKLSTSHA
jgi:hypothetical protein